MSPIDPAPRVSVVMPAYNAADYVGDAIDGILGQSWTDLELLVVDDGSTDGTADVLADRARRDRRVHVTRIDHSGTVAAANLALDLSRGEYIARADADDVCLPDRLASQVELMDGRPEIGVSGGWMAELGNPSGSIWRLSSDPDELRCLLIFRCPVANPTAMFRRSALPADRFRYDPAFAWAEDYDFWERAAAEVRFGNVQRVLTLRRLHGEQTSSRHHDAQTADSRRVRQRQIERLGLEPTGEQLDLHDAISGVYGGGFDYLCRARDWLETLFAANARARIYPEPAFPRVLAERWYRLCAESERFDPRIPLAFATSRLATHLPGRLRWTISVVVRNVLPLPLARRLAYLRDRLKGATP